MDLWVIFLVSMTKHLSVTYPFHFPASIGVWIVKFIFLLYLFLPINPFFPLLHVVTKYYVPESDGQDFPLSIKIVSSPTLLTCEWLGLVISWSIIVLFKERWKPSFLNWMVLNSLKEKFLTWLLLTLGTKKKEELQLTIGVCSTTWRWLIFVH